MKRPIYLTGCNNYTTHQAAQTWFCRLETPACLNLQSDGSATITFLSKEPVCRGQAEFVGNPVTDKYNFERSP